VTSGGGCLPARLRGRAGKFSAGGKLPAAGAGIGTLFDQGRRALRCRQSALGEKGAQGVIEGAGLVSDRRARGGSPAPTGSRRGARPGGKRWGGREAGEVADWGF